MNKKSTDLLLYHYSSIQDDAARDDQHSHTTTTLDNELPSAQKSMQVLAPLPHTFHSTEITFANNHQSSTGNLPKNRNLNAKRRLDFGDSTVQNDSEFLPNCSRTMDNNQLFHPWCQFSREYMLARYNFDLETERPVNGRYQWTKVERRHN